MAVVCRDAERKSVYFGDNLMLHVVWKETMARLHSLERSVQEGRAVDEASNYGRWLNFSGLIKIFEAYPQPVPLLVDGLAMRQLTDKLVSACGEIHKGGKMPHNPSQSTVDEINAKLDYLLSQTAKKISPVILEACNDVL